MIRWCIADDHVTYTWRPNPRLKWKRWLSLGVWSCWSFVWLSLQPKTMFTLTNGWMNTEYLLIRWITRRGRLTSSLWRCTIKEDTRSPSPWTSSPTWYVSRAKTANFIFLPVMTNHGQINYALSPLAPFLLCSSSQEFVIFSLMWVFFC